MFLGAPFLRTRFFRTGRVPPARTIRLATVSDGWAPTDSQYAERRAALEKEIAMQGDVLRESEGAGCVNMVDRLVATECDPSMIMELAEELKVSL